MPDFEPTKYANLIKSRRTGVYFVRAKVGNKPIRSSLKTTDLEQALERRDIRLKLERGRIGKLPEDGRITIPELATLYLEEVRLSINRKENTKEFIEDVVNAVLKLWPEKNQPVLMAGEATVKAWSVAHNKKYSSTRYNAAVDNVRAMFAMAVKMGIRTSNPAETIEKVSVRQKLLTLPSKEEFNRLLDYLDQRQAAFHNCAAGDVVRFLAYSGARREEALNVKWSDISVERGEIRLTGKRDKTRTVPMIAEMKTLLVDLHKRSKGKTVLPNVNCLHVLRTACKKLKIAYVSHHDFRHLFATRCIESGVDIPTVSRWLGHSDGGALAMRTYGHLRDDHSKAMALKVSFV